MKSFSNSLVRAPAFAFIIFIFGSWVIVAQPEVTGEWTANIKEKSPDKIHLSFERKTDRGGKNQNGSTYAFSDLQGLSREQAQNGRVSFSLVREAGTIACDGSFTDGKGIGTFRFVANRAFVDGMRSRGFDLKSRIQTAKIDTNRLSMSGFSPRRQCNNRTCRRS